MRFISSSDRVLDVGAGQGTLLEQVTSIGARGEGFEIDQRASQALNETGLCCHSGSLADVVRNSSGRYTVVVLNQVLEHSLAPDEMLRDCLRLLASDGRIVVATPVHGSHMQRRYGTRWINWHVPYHVNWFSTCALRLLVRRCGLRVQELHVSTPNSWFLAQRELHRAVRKGRRFRDFSTEYPSWRRLLVAPVVRAIDIARTGDAMLAVLVPRNGEVC